MNCSLDSEHIPEFKVNIFVGKISKMSTSKKGHNSEKKMHFELSPLIVWISLWIVNTYSEFQVNILSNKRYYKMSKYLHADDDAQAVAKYLVFSPKNSRANKMNFMNH